MAERGGFELPVPRNRRRLNNPSPFSNSRQHNVGSYTALQKIDAPVALKDC